MIKNWNNMTEYQMKMGYPISAMSREAKTEYARECCLALFMEVAELVDSFQWKPWKPAQSANVANLRREIVDILFFVHHIAECFSISDYELELEFKEVLTRNYERLNSGYNSLKHNK